MTQPKPSGATDDRVLAFQRLAWSSLIFSMTMRCPLQCAHCITDSGPAPILPVLSLQQAQRWTEEMPELAKLGLHHVTFTGGEPTLALRPLRILAEAASDAGLRTAVVSSGAFAISGPRADLVLDQLPCVDHWDLGYDSYHGEFLAFERFVVAIAALRDRGRSFSVRVCESPDPVDTERVVAEISQAAGPGTTIIRQPVRELGRASSPAGTPAGTPIGRARADRAMEVRLPVHPCPSTGPLLREDGSAGPCCSGVSYTPGLRHPFPSDAGRSLLEVWRSWREDQLMRLVRLAGFAPILQWLATADALPDGVRFSADPCELCTSLWTDDGRAAQVVRDHAHQPEVRARLDELERELFGSVWAESAAAKSGRDR